MPKRMIDTDLWNDDDIIADFTAEDKYFWLYLLTNPHNNICGVAKYSPALMARDMGLHKDTIINLLYRFEKVHNRLYVDKQTNEILILNWSKYNWTKSEDFLKTIEKKLVEVKSTAIKNILIEKINEKTDKTVLRPSQEGTNTNTIPNTNSNLISDIIDYLNNKLGTKYRKNTDDVKKHLLARINEGYVLADFIVVIDKKYEEWNGTEYQKFLRPSTLFGTKFQSYLNQQQSKQIENSTFDADEFFEMALKRTYGDDWKGNK